MARVKIREFDAKRLLLENLKQEYRGILVDSSTDLNALPQRYHWLLEEKLVIKPDQLFGKRGKLGLVLLDATLEQVKEYLLDHMNKEITIGKVTDKLTHFLIEPYVQHQKEYYLSIGSYGENILEEPRVGYNLFFSCKTGGVDIEENWRWVTSSFLKTGLIYREEEIESMLKLREE